MRRTKAWWAKIPPELRAELVGIERQIQLLQELKDYRAAIIYNADEAMRED